tara:strand:+ start:225 stop:470 length:246 start_codon:yes stop_codon:yes gene_type:complete
MFYENMLFIIFKISSENFIKKSEMPPNVIIKTNNPIIKIAGNPTANKLNCGATLVTIPKVIFTISKAHMAGSANNNPPAKI